MDAFTTAYSQLNDAQKQAVDAIDGPVLVLAGPGTGKTQLLSARVANILKQTDTPASTILCLTFTDSGAANMRERLTRFIGQTAYEVNIGTYHSFGGDLIRRYPEYFSTAGSDRSQSPVDELGKRQILQELTEQMSYSNPLKQTRHHLGDLMGTISELKRALITPDQLRAIAAENLSFINAASQGLADIFENFTTMPRALAKAQPYFMATLELLRTLQPQTHSAGQFGTLAHIAANDLAAALESAEETAKTTPLTTWKNNWLVKNTDNQFVFDGTLENRRVRALATVLGQYQAALEEQALYDFDDMILRSIEALEKHPNLRYSLQERYLYVLLDEFQDTNAAQLRLIELLTDNPVNEGRPNVMAVGDDDQAIYAFQGAQYSNMLDFYQMYRDVLVVNLTENYRSHAAILETAQNVAGQISTRLHHHFNGMSKQLTAANRSITTSEVVRQDFLSPIAERDWVASRIRQLVDNGTPPSGIAVLAPKHRFLEPLVPYLNKEGVPVRYEKRENILEATVVEQLIVMSRLVLALESDNQALANHLWPQVLSYGFWQLPTVQIWQLAWQVGDHAKEGLTWSKALLADTTGPQLRLPAMLLLNIAGRVHTETCETILDYLIGNAALETNDDSMLLVTSPLRSYYLSPEQQQLRPDLFYQTVSHLTVLRARFNEYQASGDTTMMLPDFIRFITMYQEAEQQMVNTSPYAQQADSVELMTVFKSKGLEFQHVFLINCLDDTWGSSARDNGNKLTLPANLQPIRHAGTTEDERLRILFVALTRARQSLYLTSATRTFSGKHTKRLKYFDEREQPDGSFMAAVLPEQNQAVLESELAGAEPQLELLELDWRARHIAAAELTDLRGLLTDRLRKYQLSPTHLTDFINLEYAGPQKFFFKTLLKFPETPLPDAQFGTTIHETLEWIQHRTAENGFAPSIAEVVTHFRSRMATKRLTEIRARLETERGERALQSWYKQRAHIFSPGDVAEKNFRNEGIFVGDAHMSGQIDRLEINEKDKTITVVDYKTGRPHESWKSDPKLHRYRLQLYSYKLLIEGSKAYKDYRVIKGRLEFIEPDSLGKVHALELQFKDDELTLTTNLIQSLWKHVQELNFPDVSQYQPTMSGVKAFEQDLLDGNI